MLQGIALKPNWAKGVGDSPRFARVSCTDFHNLRLTADVAFIADDGNGTIPRKIAGQTAPARARGRSHHGKRYEVPALSVAKARTASADGELNHGAASTDARTADAAISVRRRRSVWESKAQRLSAA